MLRVKVCGITREQDAHKAAELGADALGFIFYKKSPRYIDPEQAAEIALEIPGHISRVAVVVSPTVDSLMQLHAQFAFDVVQIHGSYHPDLIAALQEWRPVCVLQISEVFNESVMTPFNDSAAAFLLDTRKKGLYGGTGEQFDWQLVEGLSKTCRLVLAGGLGPDNVVQAIESVKPYAVDLNSGVEESPGKKDHQKLNAVFHLIKEYRRDWSHIPGRAYPTA